MNRLLIVDDNPEIRKQLKWGLSGDYSLLFAEDRKSALAHFQRYQPAVVLLDLGLPPAAEGVSEGMQTLEEILDRDPFCKVIVVTGRDEKDHALQAVSLGAHDFYAKPIDLTEIRIILQRVFYLARLEEENDRLQQEQQTCGRDSGLLGQCPQMLEVYKTVRKVATTDVPVLVLGESGSGKEMVARSIHCQGLRRDKPFIALNCGAIPETLLEAELFGHEKGAFTGAIKKVLGKIESAEGGTLFLDEIGEMSPALQVKLLRFLQDKIIQRVGGRADIPVDARIIAATNVDIHQAIENQSFREDLFYRISVVSIELPPLRERGDDILLLANLFLSRYATEFNKRIRSFSTAAVRSLYEHDWPGNVRELENKVKRSVVMSDRSVISPDALGFSAPREDEESTREGTTAVPGEMDLDGLTLREARSLVERDLLLRVIEREQGNLARSAEMLGVSRPTLYDLIKKHGLPHLSQS
ncbi:PEP-CTERM-box response regulator transcription factor [Geothermobacter hydrogeniphilus]|uniref:PEP-CTERM-box response regulator transcription factor n=1 Tax=Geothermobacter hydrogeniphilus TaxID=1969733 RepID=A0A1X0YE64_9BACT|nr:PEP-CTERM-box response regulator transcription factor [Geothermobacter hydrogeniphilus]ORJ63407.1 PEP-CTERM-box response regulator transcription factor [Geothermobacter hydrogeniphilus]